MEKPFYEFDLASESDLKNELETLHSFCSDTSNYNKVILRGPEREGFNNTIREFDSFSTLSDEYNEIEKWISENDFNIGQFSLYGKTIDWRDYPLIYKYIVSKVFEIYGNDIIVRKLDDTKFSIKKFTLSEGLLTMYKKSGRLSPHKDGKPAIPKDFTKLANILLYLNKDYKKGCGGCFVVNGKELPPDYGKLVFLNFRGDSDPEHSVSLLKCDVNRIALLFNITYMNAEKIIWNNE